MPNRKSSDHKKASPQAISVGRSFATNLPRPTPEGIQEFARLYLREFGVELEPTRALELATRTLQFVYLGTTRCPTAPAEPHLAPSLTDTACPTTTSSPSHTPESLS